MRSLNVTFQDFVIAVSMHFGPHMVFIYQHLCLLAHPWSSGEEWGLFATSQSICGSDRNAIIPTWAGRCLTRKETINVDLKVLRYKHSSLSYTLHHCKLD